MNIARTRIACSILLLAGIAIGCALTGCASEAGPGDASEEENIGSTQQALPKQGSSGGAGGGGSSCVDRWQDCYAGCGGANPGSDPRSEQVRHACEVGCDMGYSVCKAFGGSSSGGVFAP